MTGDIVVIGAGVLGLSTALHCALLGRSVVVLERDTAGSQASGRAAGLFVEDSEGAIYHRLCRVCRVVGIPIEAVAGRLRQMGAMHVVVESAAQDFVSPTIAL